MNPLRISGDFCERVDRVLRDFVSSFWKELPSDRRYPLVRRLDFVVVVVVVVGFFAFAFCRDGADDVRDEHRDPSSYRHRLKVGEIVAKSSSSKSSSSLSPGRNSRRDEMDKKMTFWNIFSSSFPKRHSPTRRARHRGAASIHVHHHHHHQRHDRLFLCRMVLAVLRRCRRERKRAWYTKANEKTKSQRQKEVSNERERLDKMHVDGGDDAKNATRRISTTITMPCESI